MKKLLKAGYFKSVLRMLLAAFLFTSVLSVQPQRAEAIICCTGCCDCYSDVMSADLSGWIQNWIMINVYIFIKLMLHRIIWFDWEFWQTELLPAFMMMGEQLAAVGTQQVAMIGMFLDATEQLETQRLLQELKARAHKDYHPSMEMCEFGTRVKSLAASERKGEVNTLVLSEQSLDRLLNNTGLAAAETAREKRARLDQYRRTYCNVYDSGRKLDMLCPPVSNQTTLSPAQRARLNSDIDYARTLKNPFTIDMDLSNGIALTNKEEDIIALGKNLYRNEAIPIISPNSLQNYANFVVNDYQKAYLKARSAIAKNSVAENSFNALVALKSEGTPGSREFLEAYLYELGVPSSETEQYIGLNPSYDAQMKLLTKTIYQNPKFYTNLYDKPANIVRKGVAMQAIGLMQKFDLYKSYLRTEASLSILLEVSVEKLQGEVVDTIGAMDQSTK